MTCHGIGFLVVKVASVMMPILHPQPNPQLPLGVLEPSLSAASATRA